MRLGIQACLLTVWFWSLPSMAEQPGPPINAPLPYKTVARLELTSDPGFYGTMILRDVYAKPEGDVMKTWLVFVANDHVMRGAEGELRIVSPLLDSLPDTAVVRLYDQRVAPLHDLAVVVVEVEGADTFAGMSVEALSDYLDRAYRKVVLDTDHVRISVLGQPDQRRNKNRNSIWVHRMIWRPGLIEPLETEAPRSYFSNETRVERVTDECPVVGLHYCYRMLMPTNGYSGSPVVLADEALLREAEADPELLFPVAGMVYGFEPLSDKSYFIPVEEIERVYARVRPSIARARSAAELAFEAIREDDSGTFEYFRPDSVFVKKGALAGHLVDSSGAADQIVAPGGGLSSGGGGLSSGGGGLSSGGGGLSSGGGGLSSGGGGLSSGGGGLSSGGGGLSSGGGGLSSGGGGLSSGGGGASSGQAGALNFQDFQTNTAPRIQRLQSLRLASRHPRGDSAEALYTNVPFLVGELDSSRMTNIARFAQGLFAFKGAADQLLDYAPGITSREQRQFAFEGQPILSINHFLRLYKEQPQGRFSPVPLASLPATMQLPRDRLGISSSVLLEKMKSPTEMLKLFEGGQLRDNSLLAKGQVKALLADYLRRTNRQADLARAGGVVAKIPDLYVLHQLSPDWQALGNAQVEILDDEDAGSVSLGAQDSTGTKLDLTTLGALKEVSPGYYRYVGPIDIQVASAEPSVTSRERGHFSGFVVMTIERTGRLEDFELKALVAYKLPGRSSDANGAIAPERLFVRSLYLPLGEGRRGGR